MAVKKKSHVWIWVALAAAAAGGGYWYYQQQQKKKAAAAAAAANSLSSNQAQGVTPVPESLAAPMEEPNSYSATPTIQNFVSNTQPTTTTSTQTTIIQPIISAFHHKPPPPRRMPPHSPHRSGWALG